MTQSQINYFIVVASEGSITRAANRLFVSQPAISKSISALERELGFSLFMRRDNSLSLTSAGSALYEFFVRAKNEYHQILKTIENDSLQSISSLHIGCSSTWNPEMFYDKIEAYANQFQPNLSVSIEGFLLSDLFSLLKSKHLDFILTMDLHIEPSPEFKLKKITSTKCGLLYSKKAFKSVTSIDDFKDTNFFVYDSNIQSRFESMIQNACQGKFLPKIKNCGNQSSAIFEVSRGNGVLFFVDWDSVVYSELFGFLPLDTTLSVNAMYLEDNSNPYIIPFIDGLSELFSEDESKL